MRDEKLTAAEYAEIRTNVLRQLQTACHAKGLGKIARIISADYWANRKGDTWIWAVYALADGSEGTAKIIGTEGACVLVEEAFAEQKEEALK